VPALLVIAAAAGPAGCAAAPGPPVARFTAPDSSLPDVDGAPNPGVARPFYGMSGGVLLLAGGANFPGVAAADGGIKAYHDEVYAYGRTGVWSVFPDRMPGGPVAEGVSIATAEGIACLGGTNGIEDLSRAWQMAWDSEETRVSFRALPPLPVSLRMGVGAAWNRRLYVGTGRQDGAPGNRFWTLDLDRLKAGWTAMTPMPGPPREQAVAAVVESAGRRPVLCVFGGTTQHADESPVAITDGYTLELGGTDGGTWSAAGEVRPDGFGAPVSLLGAAAVAVGGRMVCAGGYEKTAWDEAGRRLRELRGDALALFRTRYFTQPRSAFRWNPHLLAYDPAAARWEDWGAHPELARCGAALVVLGGHTLLVASGETKPGVRTPTCVRVDLAGVR
jgi:sialate O-acetylesterase